MKTTRRYTMTARAEAVERTRLRVLEAALALAETRPVSAITLDAVAESAGVSVQTLLRRFGSRAGLVDAVRQYAVAVVAEERRTPVGDIDAAIRTVLDHYERRGDAVLLMLAEEQEDAVTRGMTHRGRELHRSWVADTFAPFLPGHERSREELLDLLCVATDVYTWKQLRRDRGLDLATTYQRVDALVHALLTR
jgi:AcrR family transcriptional regulator